MSGHTTPAASVQAEAPPRPHRWLALVVLCLAQFMLIIDITVVQVALPSIGRDLSLGRAALTWVVTTYTLFFGGLMVLGGRLADTLGARRTLLAGLAGFVAGSLVCGLATGGAMLITGRGLQGIGAALLSPSALAIITNTFDGHDRNRALGVWAGIGGTGAALGVLLSGVLTAGPGWEWVFFINVPVGAVVLFTVPALVRPDGPRGTRQRVDVPGALVVTAATAMLIYGFVGAGDTGWLGLKTVLPLAAAVLCYVAFIAVERRATAPLMRPATLARRPVIAGTFVMLAATALLLAMFFLNSLYFQQVRGFSALKTGLIFLPVAIALAVGAQLGAHVIPRLGGRAVAAGAFVLTAIGTGLMTQISPGGNLYTGPLPGFLVAAFGVGPAFVAATTTALANVPHREAGVASGVINTFHELGGSIGVAVVSTVAAASIDTHTRDVAGFADAFTVCAVIAGITAVVALALLPAGRPSGAAVGHGHMHSG
jgi:EmrB/QacA subfamily drug resistance transporter